MGYYSTMTLDVKIKKEFISDVRAYIEQRRIKLLSDVDYMISEISVLDDGSLEVISGDYYGKWYEESAFVDFLAPFTEKGRITFIGEDSINWGYEFDGEGNVYELDFEIKRGKKKERKECIYTS